MMGYGDFGLLGWLGMGLGWIFWIAVIALLIWGFTSLTRSWAPATAETPLEILKRRYARGEISQSEFERARQDLA